MNRKNLLTLLIAFLIITLLHFLVYSAVQNAAYLRSEEAPTQRAEELAYALKKGADPKAMLPAPDPELFAGPLLSTFVLDANGQVLAANTQVGKRVTPVPVGLLPHARKLGLKQVTWQPWPGLQKALAIRYVPGRDLYAAVAGPYDNGVNESVVGFILFTWTGCLVLLLLYGLLTRRYQKP
jgi:hypothetical protein